MQARSTKRMLTAAIAATATILTVVPAQAAHEGTQVAGSLNGRNEVANDAKDNRIVGDPNGRGDVVVYSPSTPTPNSLLCMEVAYDKLAEVTGVHVHFGKAGANGPVVANFTNVLVFDEEHGYFEGCVDMANSTYGTAALPAGNGRTDLTAGQRAASITANLASPADEFYVNVHTTEFPGGAIRGQIA